MPISVTFGLSRFLRCPAEAFQPRHRIVERRNSRPRGSPPQRPRSYPAAVMPLRQRSADPVVDLVALTHGTSIVRGRRHQPRIHTDTRPRPFCARYAEIRLAARPASTPIGVTGRGRAGRTCSDAEPERKGGDHGAAGAHDNSLPPRTNSPLLPSARRRGRMRVASLLGRSPGRAGGHWNVRCLNGVQLLRRSAHRAGAVRHVVVHLDLA